MKVFTEWFLYTARIVGCPILAIGLLYSLQYTTFTITCAAAGYQCSEALGWEQIMGRYAANMIAGGKGELRAIEKPVKK